MPRIGIILGSTLDHVVTPEKRYQFAMASQ
jgi:hypothetical protein